MVRGPHFPQVGLLALPQAGLECSRRDPLPGCQSRSAFALLLHGALTHFLGPDLAGLLLPCAPLAQDFPVQPSAQL